MRNIRLFMPILSILFVLHAGCIRKDPRDKFIGTWTFRIKTEVNHTGMTGGLGYSSRTNFTEGAIIYGKGKDDLMIILSGSMLVNFTVLPDGTITNLPGDHSLGNFDGTGVINVSYGHHGNFVNMTYIYGRKGAFSGDIASANTDFSRPFTTGAFLNGIVNAHCTVTNVTFEYGTGTDYGNVTPGNLVIEGFDDVSVGADITGLIPNTVYHFRVKAENSNAVTYGNDMEFTTLKVSDPVTDIDGNSYRTVQIDKLLWMAENLKVSRLNNSIPLVNVTENFPLPVAGYCFYNNDSSFKNEYGALYNYTAVATGLLCPAGWHVPSDNEWTSLEEYTGGSGKTGGSLKEKGTTHWLSPNTGAIDLAGFSSLPGGMLSVDRSFQYLGAEGYYWSSTPYEYDARYNWSRYMFYNNDGVTRMHLNGIMGFSVRCVKNL